MNDDAIFKPAIDGIAKAFKEFHHCPSRDNWKGIEEIVKATEGMAVLAQESPDYPAFSDKYYISSLAPGMGKTTALIETVKAIMSLQPHVMNGVTCDYSHVSFIIFLSRLTEIEALVERIGLDENDYSVIVRDDEPVYKKGNQNKKAARVLFTTQAMLERRCHEKNVLRKFSEITDYYYNGKPRQVRVWDEAILPSSITTIELHELMSLPIELSKINADFAYTVQSFCMSLGSASDGDLIDVPDLPPYEELLGEFETLQSLHLLNGKSVRVIKDNRKMTTALQYADIMPDDIKPLLILDASGSQRTTYEMWKEWRKDLVPLHSPIKYYKGLTVHHWDKGAGKKAINKNNKDEWSKLVEGICTAIESVDSKKERVLIVHRKPDKHSIDLEDEIKQYLGAAYDPDRVKFLTWGRHTATNEFKDFEHVVLAGLWYYASATYEAHILASKKQDIAIPATKDERKSSEEGEHRHHVLQATCRGRVRYAIGDQCPEGCHLWIVYSTQQGLPSEDFVERIFPGAVYEPWAPIWELSGVKAKIADMILTREGGYVPVRGICQKLKQERYRVKDYMEKEIIPWLKFTHNMEVITVGEGRDFSGWFVREAIEKPF